MNFIKQHKRLLSKILYGCLFICTAIILIVLFTEIPELSDYRYDLDKWINNAINEDKLYFESLYSVSLINLISRCILTGLVLIALVFGSYVLFTKKDNKYLSFILTGITFIIAFAFFLSTVVYYSKYNVEEIYFLVPKTSIPVLIISIIVMLLCVASIVLQIEKIVVPRFIILIINAVLTLTLCCLVFIVFDDYVEHAEEVDFAKTVVILVCTILTSLFTLALHFIIPLLDEPDLPKKEKVKKVVVVNQAQSNEAKQESKGEIDPYEQIERLKKLYDNGSITKEEFDEARKKYIGQL